MVILLLDLASKYGVIWIEMVFFGEYSVSVTEGGRIAIPKKIRENIQGDMFVLTKGFDICLAGYDNKDWDTRTQELMAVSLLDKEHIEKRRLLFSGANEVVIDEQGRLVVPKALMQFLGITTGKMRIIGVGDHFEIWNETTWHDYLKKIQI